MQFFLGFSLLGYVAVDAHHQQLLASGLDQSGPVLIEVLFSVRALPRGQALVRDSLLYLVNLVGGGAVDIVDKLVEVLCRHQLFTGIPGHLDETVVAEHQASGPCLDIALHDVDSVGAVLQGLLEQLVALGQLPLELHALRDVPVDAQDQELVALGLDKGPDVFVVVLLPVRPLPGADSSSFLALAQILFGESFRWGPHILDELV